MWTREKSREQGISLPGIIPGRIILSKVIS
jgi:hypothetical protein